MLYYAYYKCRLALTRHERVGYNLLMNKFVAKMVRKVNKFKKGFEAKKFLSGIFASAVIVTLLVPAGINVAVAAAGVYSMTGSASVTGLTLTLSGTASASPYVRQLDQQMVSVMSWGDGTPASPVDVDSFTITSFDDQGNDKFFNADWSTSHTYAASGNYSALVRVHHGNTNGNEGSEVSSITVAIEVPESEPEPT